MRVFFRNLPNQPLPVRRRFVVLATAGTFAFIVLAWGVLSSLGGRQPPSPPPAAPHTGEGGEGALGTPSPALTVPTPTPTLPVDVGEVSANLLRAFGGGAR